MALRQEETRRDLLITAVEASQQSVELVHTLYLEGLTDFQAYLDAQRVLFDQQDALAQSRGNVITDVVQLNRALGGGWSLADTDPDLALEMARSDASDAAAAANRTDSDANGAGSTPAQENEVN